MLITIRAEDIMTPRRLFQLAETDQTAEGLATAQGFDAVPISRRDGRIVEFWSAREGRRLKIVRRDQVAHDTPIEGLLADLGDRVVHFVYYRSEVVGLVNASDFNKPIARLAWLHP